MNFFSKKIVCILFATTCCLPFHVLADDTIYTKVDINPVPVKTPPPEYPEEMKRNGITGVVAVSIVIDEKGIVNAATVVKSSNSGLNAAAIEAVKKWKFKPGQKDGAPVKVRVTVPLSFSLDD